MEPLMRCRPICICSFLVFTGIALPIHRRNHPMGPVTILPSNFRLRAAYMQLVAHNRLCIVIVLRKPLSARLCMVPPIQTAPLVFPSLFKTLNASMGNMWQYSTQLFTDLLC